MSRRYAKILLSCILLFLTGYAFPEPLDDSLYAVTPFGAAGYEMGQLIDPTDDRMDHFWNQEFVGVFGFDASLRRVNTRVALKMRRWLVAEGEHNLIFEPGLGEVFGSFGIGGTVLNPLMTVIIGKSHFKYNSDASHLGEYLLRSGSYPPFLVTDFEFARFQAVGLHLYSNMVSGKLRHDLLLTSEQINLPNGDYSLAYLAASKPVKMLELGGGISFHRLFPVKEAIKNPRPIVDDSGNALLSAGGDTLFYSRRGVKMMARLKLDPKPLFSTEVFGPNDLALYFETAVLGWKNVGPEYNNRLHRIPIMAGFHVPTFNWLDRLSAEVEYYPNPKMLNTGGTLHTPLPGVETDNSRNDDWRWAVYVKKKISLAFSITGIITSDHWRLSEQEGAIYYETDTMDGQTVYERTTTTKDFYWRLRITYGINAERAIFKPESPQPNSR